MNEPDTSIDQFEALEGTDELHLEEGRRNRLDKLSRSLLRNPEGKKRTITLEVKPNPQSGEASTASEAP